MRTSAYAEEITGEVQLASADVGRGYVGVRFVLHSSPVLHAGRADDDRSAVTFWAGLGPAEGAIGREDLARMFDAAAILLRADIQEDAAVEATLAGGVPEG
jgi:hypothetical protein